mgnify:CR=1 FL=1|jgi:hypothetical protein
MNLFSVDFSHAELNFLRQALETIPIQGKDAKFCAHIQMKLEQELEDIVQMIKAEEESKVLGLQQMIQHEETKTSTRKK